MSRVFVVTPAGTIADSSAHPGSEDGCFICGDRDDHFGLPHGEATGDGRVRDQPRHCGTCGRFLRREEDPIGLVTWRCAKASYDLRDNTWEHE